MIASDLGGSPWIVGRYAVYDVIARGGMATVHLGRLLGSAGFGRTVAIKRLHPHLATDHAFSTMMLDEARIAGRVQHPNVVPLLDVVTAGDELLLVMEYVPGESLAAVLLKLGSAGAVPAVLASAVVADMLHGLHAAHEATDERGAPLHIVHRDVSPQNVIVGTHGIARILDFGVAKAAGRMTTTGDSGQLKGKLSYMAPEQLSGKAVDRRVDVYAAAVVLWEALTGAPLFRGDNAGATVENVLLGCMHPPSHHVPSLPEALDEVVMRGLARDPAARYATAREMALALERAMPRASALDVADWLNRTCQESLVQRAEVISRIEHDPRSLGTLRAASGTHAASSGRASGSGSMMSAYATTADATDSVGILVPRSAGTRSKPARWRVALRALGVMAAAAAGTMGWLAVHRAPAAMHAVATSTELDAGSTAFPSGAMATTETNAADTTDTTDAMAAAVPPVISAISIAPHAPSAPVAPHPHVRPAATSSGIKKPGPQLFNRD